MKRIAFNLISTAAIVILLGAMTACGGRENKGGKTAENESGLPEQAAVEQQTKAAAGKEEPVL